MSHRHYNLTQQEEFAAMIAGLEQTGMTAGEIASKVGISRVHLWRLRSGVVKSPSYEVGSALKTLHTRLVTK